MWGVSRLRFDAFLLDAARGAGAAVLQPARCERIRRGAVTVRVLESNAIETLRPDHVLLADGKAALLPARPAPTRDFGIKAHFTHVAGPRDAIELFGARGCYGGLAAVDADRWNAAFAVPASRLRAHGGDVNRLFDEIVTENVALRLRLRGSQRVTGWLAAPLPRFGVAPAWREDVIPIGNAAAALEPIGGEGMGLAMRSAELAADELIQSHRAGRAPRTASLRARFDRLWRTRRLACRAAGVAIASPRVANLGLRLVPGGLTALALRVTGKSRSSGSR
jgi:flavin-dependent dehydrogenase